jgi:hypothetical protein
MIVARHLLPSKGAQLSVTLQGNWPFTRQRCTIVSEAQEYWRRQLSPTFYPQLLTWTKSGVLNRELDRSSYKGPSKASNLATFCEKPLRPNRYIFILTLLFTAKYKQGTFIRTLRLTATCKKGRVTVMQVASCSPSTARAFRMIEEMHDDRSGEKQLQWNSRGRCA